MVNQKNSDLTWIKPFTQLHIQKNSTNISLCSIIIKQLVGFNFQFEFKFKIFFSKLSRKFLQHKKLYIYNKNKSFLHKLQTRKIKDFKKEIIHIKKFATRFDYLLSLSRELKTQLLTMLNSQKLIKYVLSRMFCQLPRTIHYFKSKQKYCYFKNCFLVLI